MQAVILAGGEGTRLRPLTCGRPKGMMPVLNRPFLEYQLQHLLQHGVTEVVLTVHYRHELIQAHFGNGTGLGLDLQYVVEEQPLGTAGAVKNVEDKLSSTFLVFNGDIFTDLDLKAVLAFHRQKRAKATIVLTPVEAPSAFGVVETDPSGRVLRFLEKPQADGLTTMWVNAGTYVLEPEVLALAPKGKPHMFERGLFPRLIQEGVPVYGFTSRCYWIDMGTPASYLKLHRDLLLGAVRIQPEAKEAAPGVWCGDGCRLDPGAEFKGPVVLDAACVVRPGARVIGPSVLGKGCVIAEGAEVRGSVLWDGVRVGPRATVRGCLIGDGVQLQEGSAASDCILADNVVVGAGNHLEKGAAVWPGTQLPPGAITFVRLE